MKWSKGCGRSMDQNCRRQYKRGKRVGYVGRGASNITKLLTVARVYADYPSACTTLTVERCSVINSN